MPKIKSHKGVQKVLTKRKNDYKIGKPGSIHNTGYKSASYNRACRKGSTISKSDYKRIKNVI